KELKQIKAERELSQESISREIELKEAEANNFADLKDALDSPESIDTAGKAFFSRVAKEIDVDFDTSTPITRAEVTNWRGSLQGRIGWLETYLASLRDARAKLPEILKLRERLTIEQGRFETVSKAVARGDQDAKEKKKSLDAARRDLNDILLNETKTL